MKILIVEDSLKLISTYSDTIKNIFEYRLKKSDKVEVVGVVSYNEYCYFKNCDFDLVILDWNIIGGNSKEIVEDVYKKTKYAVFITGYSLNSEVNILSKKYNIPIISKPTSDIEIQEILEEVVKKIYNKDLVIETV